MKKRELAVKIRDLSQELAQIITKEKGGDKDFANHFNMLASLMTQYIEVLNKMKGGDK